MVGDVHQPLHSTTRISAGELDGDHGGNFVKLNDPSKELHFFWDGLPGDGPQRRADAIAYGKALAPADPVLAKKTDAADWISESFAIAQTSVYSDPIGTGHGPFTITPEYKDKPRKLQPSE